MLDPILAFGDAKDPRHKTNDPFYGSHFDAWDFALRGTGANP
jgi:hypothetical protein